MNIIVMGPQGSGKSTQATILANKLHLPHIETGSLYRELANSASPAGQKIKAALESGSLVDDETTFEVIDQHLSEMKNGFVIDGFPRTILQAKRDLFPVTVVFFLRLSNEEAMKRLLLRHRVDDTPELIAKRLELYHEKTEPILNYYKQKQKLVEINGEKTIEEIAKDISSEVEKILNR